MTPGNVLQRFYNWVDFVISGDTGNAGTLSPVGDRQVFQLTIAAGVAETRTFSGPSKTGLEVKIESPVVGAGGTCTVTVKDAAGATTGTIVFSAAGQWAKLVSIGASATNVAWNVVAAYGATIATIPMGGGSGAYTGTVTALALTNLTVATNATINSILATNLSVGTQATIPNITCSSNLSVANLIAGTAGVSSNLTAANLTATGLNATSVTAGTGSFTSRVSAASILVTNLSVGTGATIPNIVASSAMSLNSLLGTNVSVGAATVTGNMVLGGGTIQVTGGTAAVDTQANALLSPVLNLISVGTSSKNYFKLPAVALGLACNIVNLGSTVGIVGHTAGVSIASATSVGLATANAAGSAVNLICDGTSWWHRAIAA